MKLVASVRHHKGFALPTVLIASVVLLTILAVSVTATTSARTALKNQYYTQLAQIAGEAGAAFAQACLQQNNNIPTWNNTTPLTPATDCSGNINLSPTVRALVVGGGGGGGANGGGGGGAGGVRYDEKVPISVTSYPVTVGAGGTQATANTINGLSGGNSVFSSLTALGGGGGASRDGGSDGLAGGSGGGGAGASTGTRNNAGAGTAGQGNNGGNGTVPDQGCSSAGGGGGGASGTGGPAANLRGGNGGAGVSYNISGTPTIYAAGGPGGYTCAPGVPGSPAQGGPAVGVPPAANSGSGGVGGTQVNGATPGAAGVVIISYPVNSGIVATGGTMSVVNGSQIHRFTASGTFAVSSVGTSGTCPADSRCWVTTNDNIRSGFSVGAPTVDANGRALTIPQSGYVELIRESTGDVFRTYRQPSVQPAAVPALCSGAAKSELGWSNAAVLSGTPGFTGSTAQRIGISAVQPINVGPTFYRKDFNITRAGTYNIRAAADDKVTIYIDGRLVVESGTYTETGTASIFLDAGCHVVHAEVTNTAVLMNNSDLRFSLTDQASNTEIVVSDRTWRVTASPLVPFSDPDYYKEGWGPVRVIGAYNVGPPGSPTNWAGISADTSASWIGTTHSLSGNNYPFASYTYFKKYQYTGGEVYKISMSCDDKCILWIDGEKVLETSGSWNDTATADISLSLGRHEFGVELQNTGTVANPAGMLFSMREATNNIVRVRSDASWLAAPQWYSTPQNLTSYSTIYRPDPDFYDCNCSNAGTTNLVKNPSFETNINFITPSSTVTATRTSAAARYGANGLRLTHNGTAAIGDVSIDVDNIIPGMRYRISAYTRIADATTQLVLYYRFLDASGASIGGSTAYQNGPYPVSNGNWIRLGLTTPDAAPINAATMNVRIRTSSSSIPAGTNIDIDGVMVTPGRSAQTYNDGSSTNWLWLGIPHGSISSGPQ